MTESKVDIVKEFQNKHYYYLKDIKFKIENSFGKTKEDIPKKMLENLKFYDSFIKKIKSKGDYDKERMGKLLLNSWYHESGLNHPDNVSERTLFVGWQIIKFYYTIYSALSCVVRSDNHKIWGHDYMINYFTDNFIKNNFCQNPFFMQPFNVYIDNNNNILNKIDDRVKIEICLKSTQRLYNLKYKKNGKKVSLFHYFKFLREWANYQNPSLFIELYGLTLKECTDECLLKISYCFLSYVEIYYIKFFGWEEYEKLYLYFSEHMKKHIKIDPVCSKRYETYKKNKTLIFPLQKKLIL